LLTLVPSENQRRRSATSAFSAATMPEGGLGALVSSWAEERNRRDGIAAGSFLGPLAQPLACPLKHEFVPNRHHQRN
jgi:hypothetical protein